MQPIDARGRQIQGFLGERYEVLGLLGIGGFASVYKVRNRNLERLEALKVLNETRAATAGFMERFIQEARIVASLEHPAIIRIHDFGSAGDLLWYTMSFIDGPSLALKLDRHGRLHEEEVARLAVPLLDALDYAHARGVVHRDIKPGNVLLDVSGRPILSDFGIAKVGGGIARTATGFVLGSPGYLSPEQLRGEPVDGRSDLYSLGITLYEALTDSVPFDSEEPVATALRRITEEVEPLSKRVPGIDPELEGIVLKSLARDRSARYARAREMKAALEAFLSRVYPEEGASGLESSTGLLAIPVAAGEPTPIPAPALASAALPPSVPGTSEVPPVRRLGRLLSLLLGALAVAVIAYFIRTSGRIAPTSTEAPPVPENRIRIPTPATSKAMVAPQPAPASPSAPTVVTGPGPTISVPPPARRAAARPAATTAPAEARRAKYPPDFEELPVPTLPPDLVSTCAGRTVGLSLTVAEDGSLASTKVISSSGLAACDDVALTAVRKARYKPAMAADGKPVEGRFAVSVPF
ncbi:MAG: TonB family protein [Thermoanaerobaculia bacterium]